MTGPNDPTEPTPTWRRAQPRDAGPGAGAPAGPDRSDGTDTTAVRDPGQPGLGREAGAEPERAASLTSSSWSPRSSPSVASALLRAG